MTMLAMTVDNDYVGMTMLETKVMGTNTQLLPEVNVSTKLWNYIGIAQKVYIYYVSLKNKLKITN